MNSLQQTYPHTYKKSISISTAWKRFINWSSKQEENRLLWLGISVIGHGCILTVATVGAIVLSGNNFIFWPFVIGAMTMTLVTHIAALPTRITIPVFFLSVLIDIVIIAICIGNGFDIKNTYI
ncbi:MAG TPA: hypothetical protein VF487_12685 [Chitinophagaceae bacterium]